VLTSRPSAFLSVSMSQAGVELPGATPEQCVAHSASVQQILERFYAETGWRPKYVRAVAGAVLYTKYNLLVGFVMKRISKQAGGSTDTSQDHEYTNLGSARSFQRGIRRCPLDSSHAARRGVSGGPHDTHPRFGRLWCTWTHPPPMWSVHAAYQCPKCLRTYHVSLADSGERRELGHLTQ
jgi:hypothetical protein